MGINSRIQQFATFVYFFFFPNFLNKLKKMFSEKKKINEHKETSRQILRQIILQQCKSTKTGWNIIHIPEYSVTAYKSKVFVNY